MISVVAVTSVLLLIAMSNRFVKYLAQAASGKLASGVLFAIMGYRLPSFLELILPFSLIISVVLAYGRLYTESEMTVLFACGVSQKRLLAYTLIPAFTVALLVAGLSLYISPLSVKKVEDIFNLQRQRTEFESLTPARFQLMRGGQSVTYAERLSADRQQMFEVFMAEMAEEDANGERDNLAVIMARSGRQTTDRKTGQRYLVLEDGYRYQGRPGNADYRVTRFKEYAQRLEETKDIDRRTESDAVPTVALLKSDAPVHQATLHWRLSMPVIVLVVVLVAVPLSKTNPRQGRYAKLLPAVLYYIVYVVALNAARDKVKDGDLPVLGMWAVHLPFLGIALLLLSWEFIGRRLFHRPHSGATGGGN